MKPRHGVVDARGRECCYLAGRHLYNEMMNGIRRAGLLDVREGDDMRESRSVRQGHAQDWLSSFNSAIMNIFRNRRYTLLALYFTRADQYRSDRKGLALVS